MKMARLALPMSLSFLSSVALAQRPAPPQPQPAAQRWAHLVNKDPISLSSTDVFLVRGNWIGGRPSFPYADATPSLVARCGNDNFQSGIISTEVLLRPGTYRIEFRIDDQQGMFQPLMAVNPGDKSVWMKPIDFIKIIRSKRVVLRVAASQEVLAMQFEMPNDISAIDATCSLSGAERLAALGGIPMKDYAFEDITVPVPVGAEVKQKDQDHTARVSFIATATALTQFYEAALKISGWSPSASEQCWTKKGVDGQLCAVSDDANGVTLTRKK